MAKEHLEIGIVRVELNRITPSRKRVLKDTLSICRDVVSYLIHVEADHLEVVSLPGKEALSYMERLVHATADNPDPEYKAFDKTFYKLPCYIRRACIHAADGHIKSHETRCDQYYSTRQVEIKKGHHYTKMEPGFTYTPNACPTLYKKQAFMLDLSRCEVEIKVFIHNTWKFETFGIAKRDAKSLQKAMTHGSVLNPKLVYEYHKFYLEFPVKYEVSAFPDTKLNDRTVLGIDLGFNSGATISAVHADGSVHRRAFSPFDRDMDRILHMIALIRKYQSLSGVGQKLSRCYTKLQGLKDNYVRQLSHWIVDQAEQCGAYGIVLEHLGSIHHGKKPKGLRAKVHHWCVAKIQKLVKGLAFRRGIRVFLVNPKGTSMYAYDGSGRVTRGKDAGFEMYALCRFTTGKTYNCDLSASYNIASRYFLREIKKSISATEWSELVAKVPELSKRTMWVLDTLLKVNAA